MTITDKHCDLPTKIYKHKKRKRRRLPRLKTLILFAGCLLLTALLLGNMEYAGEWLKGGLEIAAYKVLPSVFPYLVLTGLICRSGFAQRLGWLLGKPFKKAFGMSPACCTAVLLGLISGFPLGAKCAAELYEKGLCTADEAERLTAFCNFCGPPFILGAVGKGIFSSVKLGWLLFLVQSLVSLVFGILYKRPSVEDIQKKTLHCPATPDFAPSDFTKIMGDACLQMLRIVGFVLFFSLVVKGCENFLEHFLPLSPVFKALLAGFLEISSGIAAISFDGPKGLLISALIVGFSGLSVFMQVWGFAKEKSISMRGYLLAHLFCPPITALLSLAAGKILGFF